eukprot:2938842-Pleurochrysis_carterae.AAC.1
MELESRHGANARCARRVVVPVDVHLDEDCDNRKRRVFSTATVVLMKTNWPSWTHSESRRR